MEQNPSLEANSRSTSHQVLYLWNTNVHYRVHNSQPIVPGPKPSWTTALCRLPATTYTVQAWVRFQDLTAASMKMTRLPEMLHRLVW
jgi:hypothetical protein